MKKFYYKKNESLDKTPIILRLERRHTMSVNKDGMEKEQSGIVTRTSSVSSVDQLKGVSAASKVKNRGVTKSLSEDVLSKSYLKNSAVVITETDLSSSLLYKTRKASMNSRDLQEQTPQKDDLSPVMLKDPKLKPIPVQPNSLQKKTSCLCYLAIMVAISICTIGLLAAITGIIYHEIFPDKNLTSYETSESLVDVTYLLPEIRLHDDNDSTMYGFNVGNSERLEKSYENTNNTWNKGGNGSSNLNDISEESTHAESSKMLDVLDLSQLLDSRKAEIKFQDGETIIYQVNSSSSFEYEKKTNVLGDMKMRVLDINVNETKNSSEGIEGWAHEDIEKNFKKLENLETFLNSQSDKLKESMVTDSKLNLPLADILSNNQLKEEDSTYSRQEGELNSEDSSAERNESTTMLNDSGIFELEKFESSHTTSEIDVYAKDQIVTMISILKDNYGDELKSSDLNELLNNQEWQTEHEVETLSPLESGDQTYQGNKSEHDVESMLMVINDPEEESYDTVISNRNGDISLSEASNHSEYTPWHNSVALRNEGKDPELQTTTEPQYFQQTTKDVSRMKQLDIKVSLAEAIKHLQVLDTNNKLLTSRIKPMKPKTENTKQKKLSNKSRNKDNITSEKMQYLQNLRQMLQENLQRT